MGVKETSGENRTAAVPIIQEKGLQCDEDKHKAAQVISVRIIFNSDFCVEAFFELH